MGQLSPADRRAGRANTYMSVPRPVFALATDLASAHDIDWHSHPRFQLVYAARGVVTVDTRDATWVVPPQRAVWMPPTVEHRLRASGRVELRSLYVRPDAASRMPKTCEVLEVTSLLRELIVRATALPLEYDLRGPAGRLMRLVLDELAELTRLPYHLPVPKAPPLSAICRGLLDAPDDGATLEQIARKGGLSGRTLARHFRRETGMSFAAWRRRARLLRALGWIAEGRPIVEVALELGYDSPSAFSAMFRRELGAPPSRFRNAP
jgi:AraC-like DNA-binding protein